jgi:hypothetical protein
VAGPRFMSARVRDSTFGEGGKFCVLRDVVFDERLQEIEHLAQPLPGLKQKIISLPGASSHLK